jgi:2-oxoglutarate/2-oxoacid ferredoxin oxidoreductase subunit beta
LIYMGVSGDGDTASIGMGQFVHAVRRNLNIVYIVMNNGCYGLTKGQDSATADVGSVNKSGVANNFQAIDLPALALELGATFVARSFSGDKTQLIPLIKAAISHHGFALIDVVSPCVTFNNNTGSTKSYDYVREHISTAEVIDFVPFGKEITVNYAEGTSADVKMHDGSSIQLHKLAPNWDPRDKFATMQRIYKSRMNGEILTGLLYLDPDTQDLHDLLNTVDTPLNELKEADLCPGSAALADINQSLR